MISSRMLGMRRTSWERGWDVKAGFIAVKSKAARRRVPILAALRDVLFDHLAEIGRGGIELVFGRTLERPFDPSVVQDRADKAWQAAGLERITPHACRHSYGSILIASGVNAKAVQTFMGHSSITVTYDIYGHLLPGSEAEARELVDTYLAAQVERGEDAARGAEDGQELALAGASTGARNEGTA
jgi:integrase